MKQRINRAEYFLHDGQYFPIMFNRVADDSPVKAVTNPLLSELHFYDNNDGQNFPGGHFDIYGYPPEPESLIPPPPITPEQSEGFKRDNVAHYTVGEIETIDFIADRFDVIEFCLANIVKYASRAKHKGQLRSDLIKIRNYATIALEHMDKNGELE